MSNVGGPRHGQQTLPGAGWQCAICGHLNTGTETCAVCANDPQWREKMAAMQNARAPQKVDTGRDVARKAFQGVQEAPQDEPEMTLLDWRLHMSVSLSEAHARLGTDSGEFTGHGATVLEALADAVRQFEDEATHPKCPTCGQRWPDDKELPEGV